MPTPQVKLMLLQGVLVYLSGEPGAPQPVLSKQDLQAAGMQLHPALDLDRLLARAGLQAGIRGEQAAACDGA